MPLIDIEFTPYVMIKTGHTDVKQFKKKKKKDGSYVLQTVTCVVVDIN